MAFELRARAVLMPVVMPLTEVCAALGSKAKTHRVVFWGRKAGMVKRLLEKHSGAVSGLRLALRAKGGAAIVSIPADCGPCHRSGARHQRTA